MYDSRLGRFLSLDPLQKKYPSQSPYIFAGNNPIFYIDVEGKKKITYLTILTDQGSTTIKMKEEKGVFKDVPRMGEYTTTHDVEQTNTLDLRTGVPMKDRWKPGTPIATKERGFLSRMAEKAEAFADNLASENKPVKQSETNTGYIETTEGHAGTEGQYGPKAGPGTTTINIDGITGAFKMAGISGNITKTAEFTEALDFLAGTLKATEVLNEGNHPSPPTPITIDSTQCDVEGGCDQLHVGGKINVPPAEGKKTSDYPKKR